ncbi:hypothetical protein Sipo8835_22960 [Streptomyces ipomoeae]|uniref:Uncharacterized protein n=1 Tax=Streptomyces ipomoeae TaxID=103232 RepID=A0AAE8W060_9ACTN|nr:hypothetical protein [Streptomyces ipomoeae]TQE30856.1 hypothetical protein Sipo8835_22960 [Streptomyces ipomoeae]
MQLAPLPDHSGTHDRWWIGLFNRYGHIITPLRAKGWVTDVQADVQADATNYAIRADLTDGTELLITAGTTLPADPTEVPGWLIVRTPVGDASHQTVVYNSTPGAAHDHHGNALVPLFMRLAALFPSRRDDCFHLHTLSIAPSGFTSKSAGRQEDAGTAMARYIEHANTLTRNGWRMTWRAQPGQAVACTFERAGHLAVVQLADDAI